MTPPAATTAGARTARSRPAAKPRGASHRPPIRRPAAPRVPRRISGPLRSKSTAAPRIALPKRAKARRRSTLPLQRRALVWVRALPDHTLVDRIVRGRTWIVLLGVLLAGIVAMQVEMLKLNSSIGRSIELGTALQSRNELLRASVSALSDDQRIERLAARMGMVMPGPTSVGFLQADHINAGQATANIHSPDPSGFESLLQATGSGLITPIASDQGGSLIASPSTTAPGSSGGGLTAAGTSAGAGTTTAATSGAGTTAVGAGMGGTAAGTGSGATGTTAGAPATTAGTTTAGTTASGTAAPGTTAAGASAPVSGATAATTGGATLQSSGG